MTVWTKKQQVMSLSTAESDCTTQSKPHLKDWNSERGEGPGHCTWVERKSGCHSDDVPGQPQRIGQSKTCRHAAQKVRHEEFGYEREPR